VSVASRAFTELPLSLPADEPHPHEVTPGELLASAHGAFFLGALAEQLQSRGTPARELVADVECDIGTEPLAHRLTEVAIHVHGVVPGVDATAFEAEAGDALDRLRRALRLENGLAIFLRAQLRDLRRSG
jgi:organic hydroperoxide reductase OsmC/OhrA